MMADTFDWLTDPSSYNLVGAIKLPYVASKYMFDSFIGSRDPDGAAAAANTSRLTMNYSSANQSEEENSALINILDRKRYNQQVAATKSAEERNF